MLPSKRILIPLQLNILVWSAISYNSLAYAADQFQYEWLRSDLCSTYTEIDGGIILGPDRISEKEYQTGANLTKPGKNEGIRVLFGDSKPFKSLDHMRTAIVFDNFFGERPKSYKAEEINASGDVKMSGCLVLEDAEGREVNAGYWRSSIGMRIAREAMRLSKAVNDDVDLDLSREIVGGWIERRIVEESGTKGDLFLSVQVTFDGKIIGNLFSTRSALNFSSDTLADVRAGLEENGISYEVSDEVEFSSDELGIHKYYSPKPGIDPYETTVPLKDEELTKVVLVRQMSSEDTNVWRTIGDTVWQFERFANLIRTVTISRLELDFIESKLFGDDPKGDLLFLCEVNHGKSSSQCDEFR